MTVLFCVSLPCGVNALFLMWHKRWNFCFGVSKAILLYTGTFTCIRVDRYSSFRFEYVGSWLSYISGRIAQPISSIKYVKFGEAHCLVKNTDNMIFVTWEILMFPKLLYFECFKMMNVVGIFDLNLHSTSFSTTQSLCGGYRDP